MTDLVAAPTREAPTVDWTRVEELYTFTQARAHERLRGAERAGDPAGAAGERYDLRIIETMYAQARRYADVAECAAAYFRMKAMPHARHPDFRHDWIAQAPADA